MSIEELLSEYMETIEDGCGVRNERWSLTYGLHGSVNYWIEQFEGNGRLNAYFRRTVLDNGIELSVTKQL